MVQQSTPSTKATSNGNIVKVQCIKNDRTKVKSLQYFTKSCATKDSKSPIGTKNCARTAFSVSNSTPIEPISQSNQFQILADLHDTDNCPRLPDEGTNASFHLRGNKMEQATLGTALVQKAPQLNSMDFFTAFKGNKNKTGQTLGKNMI